MKFLQKFLFHTPFVIVPTAIGEFEQDGLYWPLKYKKVAEQWQAETSWGQLFTEYQKNGVMAERISA